MITHPEIENAPRSVMTTEMETAAPPEEPQTATPVTGAVEQPQVAPTPEPSSLPATAPITPLASGAGQPEEKAASKSRVVGVTIGVALIAIGALALLSAIYQSSVAGLLILPALGVMFLAWGLVVRDPGPLIPGCILTGLGLGVLLSQNWPVTLSGEATGAVVVAGLAIGFLAITPLTWIVAGNAHYWALIPGTILALVAVSLFLSANAFLSFLGIYVWPVALVALGVFMLWRAYWPDRKRRDRESA